jgi:hypothetical protein
MLVYFYIFPAVAYLSVVARDSGGGGGGGVALVVLAAVAAVVVVGVSLGECGDDVRSTGPPRLAVTPPPPPCPPVRTDELTGLWCSSWTSCWTCGGCRPTCALKSKPSSTT